MPRYFFHVRFGQTFARDDEGTELPDLEAAMMEARSSARDIAIDELRSERHVDGRQIEIADAEGLKLAVVAVRDVIG